MYCKKCMLICAGNECPNCGSKKLHDVKEKDFVFLITKDTIWSGTIEEILKKNSIPFFKKGILGAGVATKTGCAMENYQFFVPYDNYEKAKNCLTMFL